MDSPWHAGVVARGGGSERSLSDRDGLTKSGAGFEQVGGEAMAQGIVVLLMICIQ
jgi:hypothetical protein